MASDGEIVRGFFNIPRMERVRYGPGSLEGLSEEVERLGGTKVFLLASNTLATKTDVIDRVERHLGTKAVGVYHHVTQHVHRESVLEATEQARRAGADFIVSVGGGSPIDAGKAVALCLGEGVTEIDQIDAYTLKFKYPDTIERPALKHPERMPKHITASTTLSAGEFSDIGGITDSRRRVKELLIYSEITPAVAILDPTITVYTPAWLWAASGMRAVDHCVEGFVSKNHMPFVDALTQEALAVLVRELPHATENPEDIAARGRCQMAAWMSLFALMNVQLGLSHGIGHQLGARCNVVHGVTSCIMLPHVMDYNFPVVKERQAKLAEAFGVDTRGMSVEESARGFIRELRAFIKSLGVPTRLSEVGVTREDFPGIVSDALEDLMLATNPREADETAVYALLEAAY